MSSNSGFWGPQECLWSERMKVREEPLHACPGMLVHACPGMRGCGAWAHRAMACLGILMVNLWKNGQGGGSRFRPGPLLSPSCCHLLPWGPLCHLPSTQSLMFCLSLEVLAVVSPCFYAALCPVPWPWGTGRPLETSSPHAWAGLGSALPHLWSLPSTNDMTLIKGLWDLDYKMESPQHLQQPRAWTSKPLKKDKNTCSAST